VFAGLVAILTLAAVATAAGATGPVPVRIDFAAPVGCADGDVFWGGISSRTERARAARPGEPAMRMTVRLTRAGTKVHGELRINNPGGHLEARRVDGATCAEVVQSLSLTAALAIDPLATATPASVPSTGTAAGKRPGGLAENGRAEPATPAPPETAPPPVPAPPPPPPESPAPPPRAPVEPAGPPPPAVASPSPPPETPLRPAPGSDAIRTVPPPPEARPLRGPALSGAAVAARLLSSSLSFGGELSARFASRTGAHPPSLTASLLFVAGDFFRSGEDLSIRWLAASVDGCPGWVLGRVAAIEPCLRVTGGRLTATDDNVMNPLTSQRWWGSGGVVLHAEVGRGEGFWLRAELGVDFPIVTRRFTIQTTALQAVGSTASISPTLAVGVGHDL
jgi:hypothetical protein